VSLAELETSDVKEGDYVSLTDFVPAQHYVVCKKLVKDKDGLQTYPSNASPPGRWKAVYVPLLPGAPGHADDAPPARERPWVRVVVLYTNVNSSAELREALDRPRLEGFLCKERVNDGTQALILRDYPNTDVLQLFIVLRPRPPGNEWVFVVAL